MSKEHIHLKVNMSKMVLIKILIIINFYRESITLKKYI